MASQIDICNLALANLGDSANISDFEEGSAQADHCARYYPIALDALLEMHPWGFATRRETLALLDDETGTAWSYEYALPSGCVKPMAVLESEADDSAGQPFDIETASTGDRILLTNVEDAVLRFTKRVTDTTKFTPLFVIALSRLLSAYLAGPIIKGSEGINVHAGQYKQFLMEFAKAAASDSNARQIEFKHFPSSLAARGGTLPAGVPMPTPPRTRW